jgi:hypothetical protein
MTVDQVAALTSPGMPTEHTRQKSQEVATPQVPKAAMRRHRGAVLEISNKFVEYKAEEGASDTDGDDVEKQTEEDKAVAEAVRWTCSALQGTTESLERMSSRILKKCTALDSGVKHQCGEGTWVWQSDSLKVWFHKNPKSYIAECLKTYVDELLSHDINSLDNNLQEALAEIESDMHDVLKRMQMETKVRLQCYLKEQVFVPDDWNKYTERPIQNLLSKLSSFRCSCLEHDADQPFF